jgi:hypothetical protein
MYAFLTKNQKSGTKIISLGSMLFEGTGASRKEIVYDLFYYVDKNSGPTVAACCIFSSKEEVLVHSFRDESDNIDPHIQEAFRCARQKGLIT